MKNLILSAIILMIGCDSKVRFVEHKESYLIDSVEYVPVGIPSVANLDPRWIAHTKIGKFTYYRHVEAGDSVDVIIMQRDTLFFNPVLDHSEIKENGK